MRRWVVDSSSDRNETTVDIVAGAQCGDQSWRVVTAFKPPSHCESVTRQLVRDVSPGKNTTANKLGFPECAGSSQEEMFSILGRESHPMQ